MPWDTFHLNDGNTIPGIAFGTGRTGSGQGSIDQVDQAISVGFSHIDTAQNYLNEEEAGIAVRESGLARDEIYITTKYSGLNGLDIETSIQNSLKNLGVEYVDLYLIHGPSLAQPDIPTAWAKFEDIKRAGLAKSIGVSNFDISELEILLASAKIKPTVNQVLLHPYVYATQAPLLAYASAHGIVSEAYSPLSPIARMPRGPLNKPLDEIAQRLDATADQVLLAWVKAKGAIPVTASSKKYRLEGFLAAADLKITPADIAAIDSAGAKGTRQGVFVKCVRTIAELMLFGAVAFRVYTFFAES